MSKRVSEILTSLSDFTDEELLGLSRAVSMIARERLRQTSVLKAAAYGPGDLVTNQKGSRKLPLGTVGRVVRVGHANVTVDFGSFQTWRVPGSLLAPAPKGSKMLPPMKLHGAVVGNDEEDPEITAARRGMV